jgi:hypothetical protein
MSKSGIEMERAARVVDVVRLCRTEGQDPHYPTLRASIVIARVLAARGGEASLRNPAFLWACRDILSQASPNGKSDRAVSFEFVDLLLRRFESVGGEELEASSTRRAGGRAARPAGGK